MKVLHVTTVPMTLRFLRGQAAFMRARGVELAAVSSPAPELHEFGRDEGVPVYEAEMSRQISPVSDLGALARICRSVRAMRPDVVHAHTPKGGLLGMIAAWLCGVPVRVYTIHGMPFVTATGLKRLLLRTTERVSCGLAHRVLCVSRSVREVAVSEGVCPAEKVVVLGSGSANGVDAEGRFDPAKQNRRAAREALGIPPEARVVGFVGRVVRDKGIVELAEAWRGLRDGFADLRLLVVGPKEPQDPVPAEVLDALASDERVVMLEMTEDTPPLFAAMDVLALPTYREGLPVVPLEAAAMGLPVVATRVPGCVDAVDDGVTGTLVPPRDTAALAGALRDYVNNSDLRARHGAAGRQRVLREFRPEAIWLALHDEYVRLSRSARRRGFDRLKRAIDVAAAAVGLVVLSPVMLVVAAAVWGSMGRPVLFRQVRPGRGGKPFTLVKFRTMRPATGADGRPLPDAQRLTRVGTLLRRTSLDELPQLWNVLKGDMSLVGPRPLLTAYLPLYSPEQARRHEVRPGITGWAQVNGRNAISWPEKFRQDVWYVDHRSLALDLKILALTVKKVFLREGISQEGQATAAEFQGNQG